jgi:hypothetical protein
MSEEVDEWRARAGCAKATGFPEDSLSTPLYLLAVDDCAFRRVLLPQPSAEGGEGKLGGDYLISTCLAWSVHPFLVLCPDRAAPDRIVAILDLKTTVRDEARLRAGLKPRLPQVPLTFPACPRRC